VNTKDGGSNNRVSKAGMYIWFSGDEKAKRDSVLNRLLSVVVVVVVVVVNMK
jgi:hypothetical protein